MPRRKPELDWNWIGRTDADWAALERAEDGRFLPMWAVESAEESQTRWRHWEAQYYSRQNYQNLIQAVPVPLEDPPDVIERRFRRARQLDTRRIKYPIELMIDDD